MKNNYIVLKRKKKKYVNSIDAHIGRIKKCLVFSKLRIIFSTQVFSDSIFTHFVDGVTISAFKLNAFITGKRAEHILAGLDYVGNIRHNS